MTNETRPSGPLPARASDYAHARHAGNVGDVFKHVALCAVLAHAKEPALYAESHAGDGLFTLGSVGEWTAGAQLLWDIQATGAAGRFVSALRSFSSPSALRPEKYPGSPLLARTLLPASARMVLHELDPQAAEVLRRSLAAGGAQGAKGEVREQDGFAGLPEALASAKGAPCVALVDPPYSGKHEWTQAADCLEASAKAAPQAALVCWYPLRALTRPRALLADLVARNLHGTLVELVSTPLRLKREKLNGSGVVLLNAPAGAVEELCAALPQLGPRLATHGEWSAAQIGF
jgi:23S rRNA (adenine2030-N6)-methyltransferase